MEEPYSAGYQPVVRGCQTMRTNILYLGDCVQIMEQCIDNE